MKIVNKIAHVGFPWGYNEFTELKSQYFTKKIYANINTVDFIPLVPTFNDEKFKSDDPLSEKVTSFFKNLYVPDVDKGVRYYNSLLRKFGLAKTCDDVHIVRVYTTDDTQLAETLTNDYSSHTLERFVGKITENRAARAYREVKGNLYLTPDEAISRLSQAFNAQEADETKIFKMLESLISGMRVDFPVKWEKTSYVRRTSLNIVLSSPYGHPKAIYTWIIKPLLFIILLATPVNIYGTVGWPLYTRIKAHGLFDITMGAIESITIDRGGPNTIYNIYKQPTKLLLTISIRDLYSSLSVDYTSKDMSETKLKKLLTDVQDPSIDYSHEIENIKTPMPTVFKLVKSFAPMKGTSLGKYKGRMGYLKKEDQTSEAKEENIEKHIKQTSSISNLQEKIEKVKNTILI